MEHIPVLAAEIMQMFRACEKVPRNYFDGTFGRGGHARLVMEEWEDIQMVAFDRDQTAIAAAGENFAEPIASGRLTLVHDSFAHFRDYFRDSVGQRLAEQNIPQQYDLMLLDLGVSSPQLDRADRGFSFYRQGPLDMRMDRREELTAADLLRDLSEEELVELFQTLGEIPRPYRVVRALCHDRRDKPLTTTQDFAGLIERVEGWSRKGHHPATRYFMALRLRVNGELEQVERALPDLIEALSEGGRLAVLTFHSLEDRIVKNVFKTSSLGRPVNKKVIQPQWEEQKSNARARSAKLRVFVRESE